MWNLAEGFSPLILGLLFPQCETVMLTGKRVFTEDFPSFRIPRVFCTVWILICHKCSSMNKGFLIIFHWITSQGWIIWYSSRFYPLTSCSSGYAFTEYSYAHHALCLAEYLFTVITDLRVLPNGVYSCCIINESIPTDYIPRGSPLCKFFCVFKV